MDAADSPAGLASRARATSIFVMPRPRPLQMPARVGAHGKYVPTVEGQEAFTGRAVSALHEHLGFLARAANTTP
ncbi:hypothetical protein MIPYR_10128 [uncultured Microbacterium sp.]|uniref:Uncharacterized protein n=1 Tax=uncultured Microbacterium sp. TaxID=191216 RepID=A0A1Y5NU69_9MICO|nr:hypothetical protein MIPYR_10128 [uncultured Microbacterium sp.]